MDISVGHVGEPRHAATADAAGVVELLLPVAPQVLEEGDDTRDDEAADEDNEHAAGWALTAIHELADWFNANLATPTHFERGSWKRPGQPALSWFKPQAADHVRRMHELKTALGECGVHVEVLTTRDPGVIIWHDEHQVVAEPKGQRF